MTQPQYVMRFFRKYPQFFQNYCFCLHRKVEPMTSDPIDGFAHSATTMSDVNANTTPIIPIANDAYVKVFLNFLWFAIESYDFFFLHFCFVSHRLCPDRMRKSILPFCDWWVARRTRISHITLACNGRICYLHSRSIWRRSFNWSNIDRTGERLLLLLFPPFGYAAVTMCEWFWEWDSLLLPYCNL